MLTLESLLKHAEQLDNQIKAAHSMAQQAIGALNFVRAQIAVMQKAQEVEETAHEQG